MRTPSVKKDRGLAKKETRSSKRTASDICVQSLYSLPVPPAYSPDEELILQQRSQISCLRSNGHTQKESNDYKR